MKRFRLPAVLFGLFLLLVVFYADSGLGKPLMDLLLKLPNSDKIGHFVLMGLMAFLACLGFSSRRVDVLGLHPLKSSLVIAAIVTAEEISQSFFPNRHASILDLTASLAGIFILGELAAYLQRRNSSALGRTNSSS